MVLELDGTYSMALTWMVQQGLFQKASLLATITSLWTSRNALSRTASCRLPGKLCRGCASVVQRQAKERKLARAQAAWSKECFAGRQLTSRISKAATASVLIALLDSAVDQQGFNEYHAGAAFARLAQLKQKNRLSREHLKGHVVLRLESRLLELISRGILEARGAANTLWAVAVLGLTNTRLLRELVHVVSETSSSMKPQELANCVWALACLKDSHPLVLQALPRILESLPQKIGGMKPQELSNCLWALARLREDEDTALMGVRCVAEQAANLADFMGPQDLSNCLWAAAQLCRQVDAPDELRTALVPRLVTRLPRVVRRMIPQHLANCLWSSVYLQEVTLEVLQIVPVLAREIPGKAARMNTQELSNCLWAAANLKDISREVLSIVSSVSEGLSEASSCRKLLPQHLSNCLWASAQLKDGPSGREVLKALPAILHSVPSVADMNPQEVANCLWAAAHLQNLCLLVLSSVPVLVERLFETLDGMKPQELSSCLMASARLEATTPLVLRLTPLLADASNQVWPRSLRDGVEALTFPRARERSDPLPPLPSSVEPPSQFRSHRSKRWSPVPSRPRTLKRFFWETRYTSCRDA